MAKISARGHQAVARWTDGGGKFLLRSDGVVLCKIVDRWKVYGKIIKPRDEFLRHLEEKARDGEVELG